jgi:hypothetical protein
LTTAIIEGRAAFIALYDKEQRMTIDLGVLCPTDASCPTEAFKANYSNFTLVAQVENYKTKISATKDSLVSLASTSVGDAMLEVEDFLCNMNVSFVERRYEEIKNDICNKTFMGVEKVMWGLYALSHEVYLLKITKQGDPHPQPERSTSNSQSCSHKTSTRRRSVGAPLGALVEAV